jgi:TRAP-type mannitol/chloroaromatic compound transport system permease large subunit
MAVLFFTYVVARCAINPELAPTYEPETDSLDQAVTISLNVRGRPWLSWTYAGRYCRAVNRILPSVLYVLPLFVIFIVVVGSIFFKLASPTESAALGCLASLGMCYVFRVFRSKIQVSGIEGADFNWRAIAKSLLETAKINTMILFIIAGSLVFSQALANSGATQGLLQHIATMDLTPLTVVIMMMLVLLFLGAFMDQVSMLLLTLPFFLLSSQSLQVVFNIDVIWLMVLMLITMEISLLTPPFGLLLYVMKGVAPFDVTLGQVAMAALPFILIELMVLTLLIFVPEVATWLPKQLE